MRERLLGYLIGALEPEERREVERALAQSPALRAELEELRTALEPLQAAEEIYEPPAMLTDRTCDVIFENHWLPETPAPASFGTNSSAYDPDCDPDLLEADAFASCWDEQDDALGEVPFEDRPMPASTPAPASGSGRAAAGNGRRNSRSDRSHSVVRHWSLADAVVASGVFVAAAMLFFPAIANSRALSQRAICEDRMWTIYLGMNDFSHANHSRFPEIAEDGNLSMAGVYGPQLVHSGYVPSEKSLLCPGSPLAEPQYDWHTPTIEQLQDATGALLAHYRDTAGGAFAYPLGYIAEGRYYGTRNLRRPFYALLSDAPTPGSSELRSRNHGGDGQNLLYEDGSMRYVVWPTDGELPDDPFLNNHGRNAAGDGPNDAVLGGSAASPLDVRLISR